MGLTKIACLMPTYNKFPASQTLVEEAVESFLRQLPAEGAEYELVIGNDTPGQKLVFDHPQVRIFNLDQRFTNLGAKLNWMTEQTDAEVLCRWDDDDINLPWGLQWRWNRLRDDQADFVCPKRFWATNGPKTSFEYGSFAQCMYTRSLHTALGGYAQMSFAEDADFEKRAITGGFRVQALPIPMPETFYFYRWGTNSEHLSGYGRKGQGWEKIGLKKVVPGTYVLRPYWQEDYAMRAKQAMAARKAANGKA